MLFNREVWLKAKAGPFGDQLGEIEMLCLDLSGRWPEDHDPKIIDELASSELVANLIVKVRRLPEDLKPDPDNILEVLAWSVLVAGEAGKRTLN